MRETVKSAAWRVAENQNAQPHETWMGWHAHYALSQCHVATLLWVQRNMRKCDVWGCSVHTPRQLQQIAISCKRPCYNKDLKQRAPPVVIPLPPWSTGRRRRRMSFLILVGRNWCRSLFSRFAVETVHSCDCFSEVWSEFHREHFCLICSVRFVPVFLRSLTLLRGWAIGVIFLCQLIHLDALLLGPANVELRITIC